MHRAAQVRANSNYKDEAAALGWPLVDATAKPVSTVKGSDESFNGAFGHVLKVMFKGTPVAEAHAIYVSCTGDQEDSKTVLSKLARAMRSVRNEALTYMTIGGETKDAVRKKPGSSTGFAVQAGLL